MKRTSLFVIFGYLLLAFVLMACSSSGGDEEAATDSGGEETAVESDTAVESAEGGSQNIVIGEKRASVAITTQIFRRKKGSTSDITNSTCFSALSMTEMII